MQKTGLVVSGLLCFRFVLSPKLYTSVRTSGTKSCAKTYVPFHCLETSAAIVLYPMGWWRTKRSSNTSNNVKSPVYVSKPKDAVIYERTRKIPVMWQCYRNNTVVIPYGSNINLWAHAIDGYCTVRLHRDYRSGDFLDYFLTWVNRIALILLTRFIHLTFSHRGWSKNRLKLIDFCQMCKTKNYEKKYIIYEKHSKTILTIWKADIACRFLVGIALIRLQRGN